MVKDSATNDSTERLSEEVSAAAVTLSEDAFHVLHLHVNDTAYANVRPRLLFPVSGRSDFVSFMDSSGKELALLARPCDLDHGSRQVLKRALDKLYYLPLILQVNGITEAMGVAHWRVRTDRGYATFEVLDRNRHIRVLPGGRYLITDVDGNRYEIEDAGALDERSQRLLDHET